MTELEEPPTKSTLSIVGLSKTGFKKKLIKTGFKKKLIDPLEKEFEPPRGLKIRENFRRIGVLNPAVIQHRNPSKLTLFPRVTYHDGVYREGVLEGKPIEYSCIIRQEAFIEDGGVYLSDDEEVVFQSEVPHGDMGLEDLRVVKLGGERPIHAVVVTHDGFNARTSYLRTKGNRPYDFSRWHNFGVFFPNILARDAIELVGIERYKKAWEDAFGNRAIADAKKEGKCIPRFVYLGTKDCCPYPEKVEKDLGDGKRKYYAIQIRLLPDMQIVYAESFEDLARKEFWDCVVGNLERYVMMEREQDWEESHIGLGGSPISINGNYLISYHGARMDGGRDYKGGEAIASREDPQKILERTKEPVLFATEEWEEDGNVPGKIVFPTAYILHKGLIHCFYGAADKRIGHITKPIGDILKPFHD